MRHTILRSCIPPAVYLVLGLAAVRCDVLSIVKPGSPLKYLIVGVIVVLSLLTLPAVGLILWPDAILKRGQDPAAHGRLMRYVLITQRVPGSIQDVSFAIFLLTGNLLLLTGLLTLSMPLVYLVYLHNRTALRRHKALSEGDAQPAHAAGRGR